MALRKINIITHGIGTKLGGERGTQIRLPGLINTGGQPYTANGRPNIYGRTLGTYFYLCVSCSALFVHSLKVLEAEDEAVGKVLVEDNRIDAELLRCAVEKYLTFEE